MTRRCSSRRANPRSGTARSSSIGEICSRESFIADVSAEFEHWLENERSGCDSVRRRRRGPWSSAPSGLGDLARAAPMARRAVELAPDDEASVRRLIRILDHKGDRAGALSAYEAFRLRLAAEYDAVPSPETEALARRHPEARRADLGVAVERLAPRRIEAVTPGNGQRARSSAAAARGVGRRYPIERAVGRGGMATVYLARDPKHHRAVAVKVLHPELAAGLGTERFLREIRIEAGLQHPHILPLHDSGEAGRLPVLRHALRRGESLRQRLDARDPAAGRGRARDRGGGGGRAGLRARARRRAPGHQAGEHPALERPRPGGRLRHRQSGRAGRRLRS